MRLLLPIFFIACLQSSAQLAVRIDNAPPLHLSAADLDKLPSHKVVLHDHGKEVAYEGALLHDVLTLAKFDFGKGLHGKDLSRLILMKASDGYQTVFALAEVDPTLCDGDIVLATKREGQAMTAPEGPFRIVVPRDKGPARSIRMLTEIDVKAAN